MIYNTNIATSITIMSLGNTIVVPEKITLEEIYAELQEIKALLKNTSNTPSTSTTTTIKSAVIRKMPAQTYLSDLASNNERLFNLFATGGDADAWTNALNIPDGVAIDKQGNIARNVLVDCVNAIDSLWMTAGIKEIPPKIAELSTKGEVVKYKKQLVALAWTQYASANFKQVIKAIVPSAPGTKPVVPKPAPKSSKCSFSDDEVDTKPVDTKHKSTKHAFIDNGVDTVDTTPKSKTKHKSIKPVFSDDESDA